MKPAGRIGVVHVALAVFALAILGQAARVQLFQRDEWRKRAERQQYTDRELPARRGEITDAAGRVLAQSRDVVTMSIAPREVRARDRSRMARLLKQAGVPDGIVRRVRDTTRKWVPIPGTFVANDLEPLLAMNGVHAVRAMQRTYAMSEGTRRLVGGVDGKGKGVSGLELALDSLLRGTAGRQRLLRIARRGVGTPSTDPTDPIAGHRVTLTINQELQEISEKLLTDAVTRYGASGGDIVIMDPRDGQVLALASRRAGGVIDAATAITEPFEAGSTIKPFIAAGLLERRRAAPNDSIDTGDGILEINGRTVKDDHPIGRASLTDVIRYSSNVGIIQFGTRLSAGEQYETLRDFGFGMPTGVPYPSEARGFLRPPRLWGKMSANSIAIGYEMSVTPLQLAAAYAVFANGGELVEPSLVKEIHDAGGRLRYRHERRSVRRVISTEVASQLRAMLVGVVEAGTAGQANVGLYSLAGKTGTPRATGARGRYDGTYNPNFVGFFPADNPQYVIVVKLSRPRTTIYGGTTAAPVTKAVIEAAIAARDAALDRGSLVASARPVPFDSTRKVQVAMQGGPRAESSAAPRPAARVDRDATSPWVVSLPARAPERTAAAPPRPVPDVRGLPLRDAVRSLHKAGFRVRLVDARGSGTTPESGALAPAGSLVRLPRTE